MRSARNGFKQEFYYYIDRPTKNPNKKRNQIESARIPSYVDGRNANDLLLLGFH